MGFFKKIGEKVKRVVSLNNIIGVATGNYLGVAKDALRIATTNKPQSTNGEPVVMTPDQTFLPANYEIPQVVQDTLIVKGNEQTKKMVDMIAGKPAVQNGVDQVNGFFSKVYLEAFWLKHKTAIIIAGASLVGFLVYWFGFREKPVVSRRGRR